MELKNEIIFPVTHIMNFSLDSGIVPDDWRAAYVTLSNVSNGRAITLPANVSKYLKLL